MLLHTSYNIAVSSQGVSVVLSRSHVSERDTLILNLSCSHILGVTLMLCLTINTHFYLIYIALMMNHTHVVFNY